MQDEREIASFDALSADLFYNIFNAIPPNHIPRMSPVCKRWHALITEFMISKQKINPGSWRRTVTEPKQIVQLQNVEMDRFSTTYRNGLLVLVNQGSVGTFDAFKRNQDSSQVVKVTETKLIHVAIGGSFIATIDSVGVCCITTTDFRVPQRLGVFNDYAVERLQIEHQTLMIVMEQRRRTLHRPPDGIVHIVTFNLGSRDRTSFVIAPVYSKVRGKEKLSICLDQNGSTISCFVRNDDTRDLLSYRKYDLDGKSGDILELKCRWAKASFDQPSYLQGKSPQILLHNSRGEWSMIYSDASEFPLYKKNFSLFAGRQEDQPATLFVYGETAFCWKFEQDQGAQKSKAKLIMVYLQYSSHRVLASYDMSTSGLWSEDNLYLSTFLGCEHSLVCISLYGVIWWSFGSCD